MVNCQNNTVTTQKVLESYVGEILESQKNHKDVWWLLQTNFFHQRQQLRSFVQSFKLFCWTFETFKNSGTKKKVVKCYNHMQSLATSLWCITSDQKLVFSWKDSDSMMRRKFQMNSIQYGELPKQYSYHTEGPWKLYIKVKSWRLCKTTKMCEGYSKLIFFINHNSFGHLCKVSR